MQKTLSPNSADWLIQQRQMESQSLSMNQAITEFLPTNSSLASFCPWRTMEIKAAINHIPYKQQKRADGEKDGLNHPMSFKKCQPWFIAGKSTKWIEPSVFRSDINMIGAWHKLEIRILALESKAFYKCEIWGREAKISAQGQTVYWRQDWNLVE